VPFDYDPEAPTPAEWLRFMTELWPEAKAKEPLALGEWFGYVLSGRLDLQKIMFTIGPTRGGKGIIARTLTRLIGRKNVAGPTPASLGGEFGLAPLIGKPLAIIPDARFAGKGSNVIVERLLSISGEDTLTINVKYQQQWTGQLPTRLMLMSNELPRLGDASQAIIGRIILLMLHRSWLGKEDIELEYRITKELPGILDWALEGLHRLAVTNENKFTHLETSEDALNTMRDLAAPIAAFVRDRCTINPLLTGDVDQLYNVYRNWAEDNGIRPSSKQVFGRDLRAAYPTISISQVGARTDRRRVYNGIALRSEGEGEMPF
jgi:putative DNA primase/helicase